MLSIRENNWAYSDTLGGLTTKCLPLFVNITTPNEARQVPLSLALLAGWPDWVIFHQLGYFWRLIIIFWKDKVAQNNGVILGYFLFKQIYYIFT
jgi:hypothetical protein